MPGGALLVPVGDLGPQRVGRVPERPRRWVELVAAASQQRRRKSAYGTAPAPDSRIRGRAASICVARSTLRASSTVRLAAGSTASGSRLASAGAGAGGTRPSRLIHGNTTPTPRSRIRSARGMKRSGGTAGRNAGCSCRNRRSPSVVGAQPHGDKEEWSGGPGFGDLIWGRRGGGGSRGVGEGYADRRCRLTEASGRCRFIEGRTREAAYPLQL
uniref:Uncharacterized protein n=1 Tax=Zea mays TaxID=4577 RepID=A0A804RL86_MAIZE